MKLDASSRAKLAGVHPDLVRVIERAAEISPMEFRVIEGMRTLARQKQLKAAGASKTLNSRHLTGHAFDVAPVIAGKISWDWPLYHRLAKIIKQAARDVGVTIEWGGDWKWKDGPHWQLPWSKYPIQIASLATDFELQSAWLEAADEEQMGTPAVTPETASTATEAGAGIGGAALLTDGVMKLQEAERSITAGTVVGMAIGIVTLAIAAGMLFDRWDNAGRPLPRWLPAWVKRGLGADAD